MTLYTEAAKKHLCLNVLSATFLLFCFVCLKERNCETRKNVNFDSFSITYLTSVDCFKNFIFQ